MKMLEFLFVNTELYEYCYTEVAASGQNLRARKNYQRKNLINSDTNNIIAQPLEAKTECGMYVHAIELDGFVQSALQINVFPSETHMLREAESRFFPSQLFGPYCM